MPHQPLAGSSSSSSSSSCLILVPWWWYLHLYMHTTVCMYVSYSIACILYIQPSNSNGYGWMIIILLLKGRKPFRIGWGLGLDFTSCTVLGGQGEKCLLVLCNERGSSFLLFLWGKENSHSLGTQMTFSTLAFFQYSTREWSHNLCVIIQHCACKESQLQYIWMDHPQRRQTSKVPLGEPLGGNHYHLSYIFFDGSSSLSRWIKATLWSLLELITHTVDFHSCTGGQGWDYMN